MGTLFVVSTPIGNLEDITIRAIKTLFNVDVIACEDTRRSGLLLTELVKNYSWLIRIIEPKKPRLIRLDDHTENAVISEVIQLLNDGQDVALVSDAGTPLISDPGYRLISECRRQNINIVSTPGPTALAAALSISGLPTNTFTFLGYPPEKQSNRKKLLSDLLSYSKTSKLLKPTYIFYCAPHKLERTLLDMKGVVGDITITIARELTKKFENVWSGAITEALSRIDSFKGELVILFRI